jgi:hypothetical protein
MNLLFLHRLWDTDVYSDLHSVRDISDVLDVLLEVLDPEMEGVVGGVAEDMDEEDWYQGLNIPPTV